MGKKVIALLGFDIVENDHFNRKKIAEKVFNDRKTLKALEKIIHPVVLDEIEKRTKKSTQASCFVIEMPLLYEMEKQPFFDAVIAVTADDTICKQRIKEKGMDESEYAKRMAFQMKREEKQKRADYVIENNGSMEDLRKQVKQLYQTLLANVS